MWVCLYVFVCLPMSLICLLICLHVCTYGYASLCIYFTYMYCVIFVCMHVLYTWVVLACACLYVLCVHMWVLVYLLVSACLCIVYMYFVFVLSACICTYGYGSVRVPTCMHHVECSGMCFYMYSHVCAFLHCAYTGVGMFMCLSCVCCGACEHICVHMALLACACLCRDKQSALCSVLVRQNFLEGRGVLLEVCWVVYLRGTGSYPHSTIPSSQAAGYHPVQMWTRFPWLSRW